MLSVFRTPSGYSGSDIGEYRQPGSNGLTLDAGGSLVINQHGNRRVVRLEKDGSETVITDRFEGRRLNSPNDLVYRSDGTLYFTDPPFGLPKFGDDKRKELAFSGVFAVKDGKTRLLTKEFSGPNGIAFSPDEKYLYVGNWDDRAKVVKRYGRRRWFANERSGILRFHVDQGRGCDRRHQGGPGGQRVCVGARRTSDRVAKRKTARYDHYAAARP